MKSCYKESEHHSNGIREFHIVSGDFTGKPHCPHCGHRLLSLKATRLANVTVDFMAGSNLNASTPNLDTQIQFCPSPIEFACGICGNRFPFNPNEATAFLKGGAMPASSPSMLASVNALPIDR